MKDQAFAEEGEAGRLTAERPGVKRLVRITACPAPACRGDAAT
jgi:hypothetical protein